MKMFYLNDILLYLSIYGISDYTFIKINFRVSCLKKNTTTFSLNDTICYYVVLF